MSRQATARRITAPQCQALLGASLFSFTGVFVRLADVSGTKSALWRSVYALPLVAGLVLVDKHRNAHDWSAYFDSALCAIGVLEGIEVIAYQIAVTQVGVGVATVLSNLQVVIVAIVGAAGVGPRPSRAFWIGLPLAVLGAFLLVSHATAIHASANATAGVAAGLASAVVYAAFLLLLARRQREIHICATGTLASTSAGTTVAVLCGALAARQVMPGATLVTNGYLICLALSTPVVGWLLITVSIRRLSSAAISLLLLLQPTLALVWGWAFFSEPISKSQLVGALLVLLSFIGARGAVVGPVGADHSAA